MLYRYAPIVCAVCAACAFTKKPTPPPKTPLPVFSQPQEPRDPAAVTDTKAILISGATVMTAAGDTHSPGYVILKNGRILEVGPGRKAPTDETNQMTVVDAAGMYLTPGIIDTHSHMGVYPMPFVSAHEDGNEMVDKTTPEVWAEHAFWPQDPELSRALTGGITTIQVLPGSANLIGGRSFVAKLTPFVSAREMRFPGAPQGLKMACGENPKRVYGEKGGPMTRMGNVFGYREAFQKALEYRRSWQKYERDLEYWQKHNAEEEAPKDAPDPPTRDLALETLSLVLDKKIYVHNHCYRADEMHLMLDLAHEFGFVIKSFHHALEAYKLRGRLAQEGVASSTWADWWGFKMEAFDGVPQNAALLTEAGARAIIHSDSGSDIRHLNQEAAKAQVAGAKVGIVVNDNDALRWLTANPAWALGVDGQVGTLEAGKMADVVLWDGHPFSVYSRVQKVYIDGRLAFDRGLGRRKTDFELGLVEAEVLP